MTRRFPLLLTVGALLVAPASASAQTTTDPLSDYAPTTPTSTVAPTTSTTTDTGAVSPATTSSTATSAPTTSQQAPAATSDVAPSSVGSNEQPQALAYTGADPALVAMFGIALLMLGAGVRLRFARQR